MSDYHYWDTRFGSIGVDTFSQKPHAVRKRFGVKRGRRQEIEVRIPLTPKWTLELSTKGKSYRELVGAPKYLENLDWIIDEFDSSFNDLAVASLRYHMDHAVTYCDPEMRAKYQDLIDRLLEPAPGTTEDESAAIDTWDLFGDLMYGADGGVVGRAVTECPEAASEAFDSWRARCEEWENRQLRARHDFVDIMRELWS
jgi:hypothetical protein